MTENAALAPTQRPKEAVLMPSPGSPFQETPGAEFTIVHNPRATNPLPDGWLELGDEYWLDGSDLRHVRHAVNNWQ
jgi:hypothetical protein